MKTEYVSVCKCGAMNENYGDGWQKSNHLTRWLIKEIRNRGVPHTEIIEEECIFCEKEKKEDTK